MRYTFRASRKCHHRQPRGLFPLLPLLIVALVCPLAASLDMCSLLTAPRKPALSTAPACPDRISATGHAFRPYALRLLSPAGYRGCPASSTIVLSPSQRRRARRACAPLATASLLTSTCPSTGEVLQKAPSLAHAAARTVADPKALQLLRELDERLRQATGYLRPSGQAAVSLALEVAFIAHSGQTRRSGEPFITHPVEVGLILAETQMDKESVISGLLHDTVEDTMLSFEEIEAIFGPTVRKIVEGETKVSKLPKMVRARLDVGGESALRSAGAADEQVENLRSMFIAMADDWRIVVVKLADRLHNMRTLEFMPHEKRVSIARETLEIFAPLAGRLGMWHFKTELADLAFKHLFPKEYDELAAHIESRMARYTQTIDQAKAKIQRMLHADQWLQGRMRSVAVTGRTKSLFSTWKKMQRHGCGIERINDLVALRVVLLRESDGSAPHEAADGEDVAMCYHVLGKVHSSWKPLPRTLKDYISSPKPNGYRSLHTTVLVGTQPLEVQIRTLEMHNVAEHGAAAHWAYKDKDASLPWLQIIRQWQAQVDCAHDFVKLVREELLGTRVFVFTRNGRILNMARGATVGDAATMLHATAHGAASSAHSLSHMALVNGAPAAPNTELRNGDIVSLERRQPLALRDLLLGSAKNADAKAYAKLDTKNASVKEVEVEKEAGSGLGAADSAKGLSLHARTQRHLQRRSRAAPSLWPQPGKWERCAACLPLVGESLVGATTSEAAASINAQCGSVHRADAQCRVLQRQLALGACTLLRGDQAQPVLRSALAHESADDEALGHLCRIVVFCKDRRGILLDVSTVVTDKACNIMDVHSETLTPGREAAFQYTVHLQDAGQLAQLLEAVAKVPGVVRVRRENLEELMSESPAAFWANCYPLPGETDGPPSQHAQPHSQRPHATGASPSSDELGV